MRLMTCKAEKKLRMNFKAIPISRAIWVTRTFEQAMHYAYDSEGNQMADIIIVELPEKTYVIADIGDDGVLLLLPDQNNLPSIQLSNYK